LTLAAVFAVTAAPASMADVKADIFREIASELIRGLDQSGRPPKNDANVSKALRYIRRAYDQMSGEKLRVAIWPFDGDEVPIPKASADEFNDTLLAQLQNLAGGRYSFIARETLKSLIADMESTGALDAAAGNPINALMKKAGNIHVLISGKLRLDGASVALTYRAVRTDGVIAATTTPRSHPYAAPIVTAMGIDQAVNAATRHFADHANDMEVLFLGGVRYGASGAQPPFGRRLQGLISAAMENRVTNTVTGQKLKVKVLNARTRSLRGVKVDAKILTDKNMGKGKGAWVLSGNYWELAHAVEVRLRLRNDASQSISWVGRVRIEDTQGSRLKPGGNLDDLQANDGLGPFAFHLTTQRGKDPAYRVGEKMNLLIRLDREAWIYCFYRQSDTKMIQILPNPHMRFAEPRLTSGVLHTIPGEGTFPFDLKVTEPLGYELLKCFATSRNVTDELPDFLRGANLDPLPQGTDHRLSSIFRSLPEVAVSEQSLVVTVTAQK
jgi:hypothetical protein